MEHLVRIYNERDRRTLEWLRRHVGNAAIALAVEGCAKSDKPYLSAVCRRLGVQPPEFSTAHQAAPSPVAEHSLAAIRLILASRAATANSSLGGMR
ncbi:hypothetical protein [Paraburkholderia fynbosensis]|uniref:Uncharacterized protein n=1 Tax=Paraburkholderia fynbosensis TaxID=1200993 RepID=A0A6J5GZ36_9BURK|nr:hypothetical protein [Paraburkholderia fynbosensis]CAB3809670.1 hypothetical protein LMG27177_06866 [Paraburkholderia fynbosensis]